MQEYVPVTEVTLNVTEANLKVGETVQLTAIVAPDNASQEVLWVSDAEGIASVDSATGLVTANSAGTAIITATSTMNPEKKAQCTVVVTRDDTALDVAIKAAEEKIREENFENKYTEASKTALRENLENAKLAKENANLSVEDVKLVVDALNASIEELQLKAVVTINNNDQIETKYCEIGEQVRVVAQTVKDKKFSHWTFNGTPICYSSPYTFTVYGNTTIEAVYVENNVVVEKKAIVTVTAFYDKATSKANFLVKRSLPEGSTVKEHGIILTDSTGWDKLGKEGFVINAERTVKGTAKTKGLIGNYSYAMKSTRATTWYGKGYVIYTDKTGEEHTLYSDVVPCEVIR